MKNKKYQFEIYSEDKNIVTAYAEPADGKFDAKFKKKYQNAVKKHFEVQGYPKVTVKYVGPVEN